MEFIFTPATKDKARLRMAICGPTGSGKTYTALAIATAMSKKVALIDTEHRSASKYGSGKPFHFSQISFAQFHPDHFIAAIHAAEKQGFEVLIIDSLTHAWVGFGGVLDQADNIAKRNKSANSFTAWKEASPMQRRLIDAILQSDMHIICTMRSKMDYVLESIERGGRTTQVPKKIGLAPVQRDDVQYEFDVVGEMDQEHNLVVSKTRCPDIDNAVISKPGAGMAKTLTDWLSDGDVITPDGEALKRAELHATPAEIPEPEWKPDPPSRHEAPTPPLPTPAEEPKEPKQFWDTTVSRRVTFARDTVQRTLRATEKYGPDFEFDANHTRAFLNQKFGLSSHKQATKEHVDALLEWLRKCNRTKEIAEVEGA